MDRLRLLAMGIASLWVGGAINISAMALPVDDRDFSCIDPQRAETYIRDFQIDVKSFGGVELCDATIDSKKLFNDLQLVEEGQFKQNGSNTFIRDFVPADRYFPWLKEQTRGIERGHDLPWATAYNSWGYFTMQDGWAELSTLGRVGTLIHEARHTEGYSHTGCDHGPYKGSSVSGCDHSLDSAGSHGVEMEYYARVSLQGANFHPVYQAMARLMLLGRSNFVFNESPMAAQEALVVRGPQSLVKISEERRKSLEWNLAQRDGVRLKKTSFGATLLNLPGQAWALDLSPENHVIESTDDFSYFKLLNATAPENLIDLEEFDMGNRRYMFALDSSYRLHSFEFGRGAWKAGQIIDQAERLVTTAPDGQEGIYALFSDSTYCSLSLSRLNCQGPRLPWPPQTERFVKYRDLVLRLDVSGRVYAGTEEWNELSDVYVLDLVKIPHYDVFE